MAFLELAAPSNMFDEGILLLWEHGETIGDETIVFSEILYRFWWSRMTLMQNREQSFFNEERHGLDLFDDGVVIDDHGSSQLLSGCYFIQALCFPIWNRLITLWLSSLSPLLFFVVEDWVPSDSINPISTSHHELIRRTGDTLALKVVTAQLPLHCFPIDVKINLVERATKVLPSFHSFLEGRVSVGGVGVRGKRNNTHTHPHPSTPSRKSVIG